MSIGRLHYMIYVYTYTHIRINTWQWAQTECYAKARKPEISFLSEIGFQPGGMLAECSRNGQFWHKVPPIKIKESIGYTSLIFHKTSLSNIVTVFNLAECSWNARGVLAEQRFSTSRNARGMLLCLFQDSALLHNTRFGLAAICCNDWIIN